MIFFNSLHFINSFIKSLYLGSCIELIAQNHVTLSKLSQNGIIWICEDIEDMLKFDLYKFLSTVSFEDVEIKEIFKSFLRHYPDYQDDKKFYTKAYWVIRGLQQKKLIFICKKQRNLLYTSNYSSDQLLSLLPDMEDKVLISITNEQYKLNTTLNNINLKISIFSDYLNRFPVLGGTIEPELDNLKEQKNVVKLRLKITDQLLKPLTIN